MGSTAAMGEGYVLSSTVTFATGVKMVGETVGYPVPKQGNGGSRILARITLQRAPLFAITEGCGLKGLFILYDQLPYPDDDAFTTPESEFYYPTFEDAVANFRRDHVPDIGPAIYVHSTLPAYVFACSFRHTDACTNLLVCGHGVWAPHLRRTSCTRSQEGHECTLNLLSRLAMWTSSISRVQRDSRL